MAKKWGQILTYDMVYVIKDKSENIIWIKSDNVIPKSEEDIDRYSIIFSFSWDIHDLEAYLRPWIIPGRDKYYRIEVIDALENIKDLPCPPEVEMKMIYNVHDKISKFEEAVRELIRFGLLPPIDFPVGDYSWIVYKDDLLSYLYQLWPEKYVDLGWEYYELDREDKTLIQKLYSFNTRPQQEKFLEDLKTKIPEEFILSNLKASQKLLRDSGIQEIKPEFINKNIIWISPKPSEEALRDRIFDEFPIGSVWEKSEAREKLDKIEADLGLQEKIRMADLEKYFELPSIKNKKFKIVRRK